MVIILILFWFISHQILIHFICNKDKEIEELVVKLTGHKSERIPIYKYPVIFFDHIALYISSPIILYVSWFFIHFSKLSSYDVIMSLVNADLDKICRSNKHLTADHLIGIEKKLFEIYYKFPKFW